MLNRVHLQKQDRDMLLIEIIICAIILSPNAIPHIFKSASVNVLETKEHQQIDAVAYYIVRLFLLYMTNTFSFSGYLCQRPYSDYVQSRIGLG